MHRRSVVLTAAVMTGLLLGIVLAPSVRGGIASAQTEPPTATAQPQAKSEGLRALFLDKLAAALGIQRPAVDSAITSAANATVNEAVQQGTLTQEQADAIKPRLQTGDVGPLFGGRGFGRGSHGGLRDVAGVKQAMLDAAASTLGITTAELNTQLRSGQTIAQLAQAHNTTEQAVVDAALAAAKTRLDAAVTAGTLTKAQADAVYAPAAGRAAIRRTARRTWWFAWCAAKPTGGADGNAERLRIKPALGAAVSNVEQSPLDPAAFGSFPSSPGTRSERIGLDGRGSRGGPIRWPDAGSQRTHSAHGRTAARRDRPQQPRHRGALVGENAHRAQ